MNAAAKRAHFALGVLFLINLMNFYDRQIIAAVTEPVRTEWKLSDTQMGILGTAFTLIYAAVGVPLGRLADRTSRSRILSAGITVWSLLTAASGATWNYASMFVTRLGVGIGEASCAPAANSLVGDLFPPRQRARALSIFMLGLPLGIFFSNLLSGSIAQSSLGWRAAFYVACIPGLLCGVLTFFIREPGRGQSEGSVRTGDASAPAPAAAQRPGSPYLLILGTPTIAWIIISGALHNFNMYALNGFVPALIARYHSLKAANAGLVAGIILGAVGVIGLLAGGWIADRVQRVRPNGRLIVAATAMLLSAPCLWVGLNQPPGAVAGFMACVGLGVMLMYVYYAGVYAAIQDVIEPGLRATAMALYFFAMYVLGGSFGTYVMGLLSDHYAQAAMAAQGVTATDGVIPIQFKAIGLHTAMYLVPIFCVLLGLVLLAASRTVSADMRKLAGWYNRSAPEREPQPELALAPSANS
jgi:MFS family permease